MVGELTPVHSVSAVAPLPFTTMLTLVSNIRNTPARFGVPAAIFL